MDAFRSLPPITFTAGEATAIAIAVSAEPQLPFRPEGRVALGKVLSSMTREQRARARDIGRRVWMRAPPTTLRPRCARVIDEAIRQHCVVHLDYRDASGQLTEKRPVEPMVLARTNGHWYLLAWCRTRAAGRWFRLDRITGARTTNEAAPDRDLEEVFGTPPGDAQPVDVSARRAASR